MNDDEHGDDLEEYGRYDLFFIEGFVHPDDAKAVDQVTEEISQGMQNVATEDLHVDRLKLFAGFFHQFPDLFPPQTKSSRKKPPEDLLLSSWSKTISVLSCPMELAEDLVPFGLGLAKELGLTVFDGATGNIHRPEGYDGIEMAIEGMPIFMAPTLVQIHDAVVSMTPEGGPSTLALFGRQDCYAQIGGGDGIFTCEWRDLYPDSYQHWVAGRKSKAAMLVRLPTSSGQVVIYENECLSAEEVVSILQDCAEGRPRSNKWKWRERTDECDS